MPDPLVLYSTASFLAYRIAQQHYRDVHHAWCSPIFDGRSAHRLGPNVPPTSSPCEIYWSLRQEVDRGDRHSSKIIDNRNGILRGANVKRAGRIIDAATESDIVEVVRLSETSHFRPLLFVIPFARVKRLIQPVPVGKRAHPLSIEYVIPLLPGRLFDVIKLERSSL